MAYGALLGAGIGGVAGAIGGAFEGAQQAREAKRVRRRVRTGIDLGVEESARSTANIMSSKEYLTAANFIRGMFGLGDVSSDVAGQVQGEYGTGALGSSRDRLSAGSVLGTNLERNAGAGSEFTSGGSLTPLETNFLKNLQAAQASRGIHMSAAAGAGEAAGLAAFRTQIQMQMVPQLLALAEAPAAMRAKYEGSSLARNVFQVTGGAAAYGQAQPELGFAGSALSGAFKGLASGAAMGANIGGGISAIGAFSGSGKGGIDDVIANILRGRGTPTRPPLGPSGI